MATKAQHASDYQEVPRLLRAMRQAADLTQRGLGRRVGKPQSWVHNCETANRRVDPAEFIRWADACELDPNVFFARLAEIVLAAPP